MPNKPKRPCSYPGCSVLTIDSRCDKHKLSRSGSSSKPYNSRWQRYRIYFLRSHPLCVECVKQNKIIPATIVDHIKPHKGDMKLFWDVSNHQALCKRCHDIKTATEDGGFGRPPQG